MIENREVGKQEGEKSKSIYCMTNWNYREEREKGGREIFEEIYRVLKT